MLFFIISLLIKSNGDRLTSKLANTHACIITIAFSSGIVFDY
jgi:hypothetical protein